jgi:hypothetical protein
MSEAAHLLSQHLRRVGMDKPADAAQQFQVTLLRQWADHLEAVLDDNGIDRDKALAIIRQVIYGGVPGAAEAELRETISEEHLQVLRGEGQPPAWSKV